MTDPTKPTQTTQTTDTTELTERINRNDSMTNQQLLSPHPWILPLTSLVHFITRRKVSSGIYSPSRQQQIPSPTRSQTSHPLYDILQVPALTVLHNRHRQNSPALGCSPQPRAFSFQPEVFRVHF